MSGTGRLSTSDDFAKWPVSAVSEKAAQWFSQPAMALAKLRANAPPVDLVGICCRL